MGIARAIRRVKRQAKQGGLNAVISGLGEGLRSRSVPAPLRGAARKIASLIDPARGGKRRSSAPRPDLPEIDPGVARPPAEVTVTGLDTGIEPNDEPREGTPVDATRVGATPTYNATPIEVAPIDATPAEVTPLEVTPLEVSLRELTTQPELEDAELEPPAQVEDAEPVRAEPKPAAKKSASKKAAPSASKPKPAQASADAPKEKLAAASEPATSVPRPGSKTPKKRPGTRADTTSKKK